MPVQPALDGASSSDFTRISDAECFCIAKVVEAAAGATIKQLIRVNTQQSTQQRLRHVLAGMQTFIQRRQTALATFQRRVPPGVWGALGAPKAVLRPSRQRKGVFRVGKHRVRAKSMAPLQACHDLLTVDYACHVAGVRESQICIADLALFESANVRALMSIQ